MAKKKDFKGKIQGDFEAPVIEEKADGKPRLKAFPGARLIPTADIFPDPEQPRTKIDKEKLNDLVASVKSTGIIEPITVREDEQGYKVVTGERRFKAAQLAGLKEIPCILKKLDDKGAFAHQLIENLQREDLSPIDEATALKKLLGTGVTQVQAAKMIGKSQPYISQSLKILDLPKSILEEAQELEISKEHMLQLIKAKNPKELWQQVKTGTTAVEIKQEVKKEKPSKGRPKIKPWTWKPEDKSFTVQIRFKKQDYQKGELIQAFEQVINHLKEA